MTPFVTGWLCIFLIFVYFLNKPKKIHQRSNETPKKKTKKVIKHRKEKFNIGRVVLNLLTRDQDTKEERIITFEVFGSFYQSTHLDFVGEVSIRKATDEAKFNYIPIILSNRSGQYLEDCFSKIYYNVDKVLSAKIEEETDYEKEFDVAYIEEIE